jgi:hypothetical protein
MNNYNYAEEITRDSDYRSAYNRSNDPKEQIVNEQDEDIILNFEDEKNESDEQLQAFEEGIKNDSVNTEEDNTDKRDKKSKSR